MVPDPPRLVGNVFAREWVSKLTLQIFTPKEVSSLSSFGHLSSCSSLLSFILYTVFNLQDREADKSQGPVHSTPSVPENVVHLTVKRSPTKIGA